MMPLPVECWPDAPLNASLQRIALQFVSGAAVSEAKRLQFFARQCGQRLQRFTSSLFFQSMSSVLWVRRFELLKFLADVDEIPL
jgi:hypothetical protein